MFTIRKLSELDQNARRITQILHVHNEMNPRGLTTRMAKLTAEETQELVNKLVNLDRVVRQITETQVVLSVQD